MFALRQIFYKMPIFLAKPFYKKKSVTNIGKCIFYILLKLKKNQQSTAVMNNA